jgi:hypothetical protein
VPGLLCGLQHRLRRRVTDGIGIAVLHEVGVVRVEIRAQSFSRFARGGLGFSGYKVTVVHLAACQLARSSGKR